MLSIRVVKEQPRPRHRPIRKHLDQPPLGNMLGHAILLEVIGNAESAQCGRDADVSMIGDDRTFHRDIQALPPLLELPAILPAVCLKPPVDAGMLVKVGRRRGCSAPCQVFRSGHGHHLQVRRKADRDHVFLKLFPMLVALYLQFRNWKWGDWAAAFDVNLVSGMVIAAMVLLYVLGWVLMGMRIRLDTYVNLLEASLADVSSQSVTKAT